MASSVDISNIALSHLGARAQVSAIEPPDGSVEAGYCARFYPLARREVLEASNFTFAKTRATLAAVTNPSQIYDYAYAVPSNCIRPLRVLQATLSSDIDLMWPMDGGLLGQMYINSFTERGSADFEVEDGVLLTNEPDAVLLYKRDVTDTTRFTPLVCSAIGMVLAGYLAGPIIKGMDGAKIGAQWREQGFRMLAKAAASDANGSSENNDHVPAHIAARA